MFEARRRRVLVVDDEPLIADTLSLILNQKGFEATVAYTGEIALVVAATFKPDVLIIDVTIEEMNGVEAARRICETLPRCRVILISGHSLSAGMLESAHYDGLKFEFLARPVHPTVFINRINAQESFR